MLYNDEVVQINTNYVNFKNCLFDLDNQVAVEHTAIIFTVNQLAIDYNSDLPYNSEVEKYLDEISNYNVLQTTAHTPNQKAALKHKGTIFHHYKHKY